MSIIVALPRPLLAPLDQPQELVHVVSQIEEMVDESHGHSGCSVIKVQTATLLPACFVVWGVSGERQAHRKSFQARRLSALRSSLGCVARISCGDDPSSQRPKSPTIPDWCPGPSPLNQRRWGLLMASAVGRRLTGGAAVLGTEGSSRLTADVKQSVYLVHSRRTDAFLTPREPLQKSTI